MSNNTTCQSAIHALLKTAGQSRQRRLLVLSGEQSWSSDLVAEVLRRERFQHSALITRSSAQPDAAAIGRFGSLFSSQLDTLQALQLLGQELDFVVYDCWAGLDPNALAAVTGTLCGGGLLVLLVPPLAQWPQYEDPDYQRLLVHPFQAHQIKGRFLTHIQHSVCAAKDALLIEQGVALSAEQLSAGRSISLENKVCESITSENITFESTVFESIVSESTAAENTARLPARADHCLSDDQSRAVAAIVRVATGHRRRPLVITADRGRGKSSALGIASARLMQQSINQSTKPSIKKSPSLIIITAPRFASVQPVFEHAAKLLGLGISQSTRLQFAHLSLQFVAPDELLRHQYQAALLLVDEAAAIPAFILEQYLQRYSRIVFSTTVHGYEGSGRGFDLRFSKTLDAITPQWKAIQLQQPIRWAANDPLERWLFDALLLDASAANSQQIEQACASHCVMEKLDRDQLLADKKSLKQLLGLLITAHYQTTPADLRNLLDGPNISVWLSRFQGDIVAVALMAEEGGFDGELSTAIWQGRRRPRGHLLPQTLSAHGGLQQAAELKYWRIMRIAVHPAVRRRGLGKQLIHAITEQARLQHCDFIGSSFAATADVLSFWRSLHCVPVRLGVSRDTCSGCFSAIVLSSLSCQGSALMDCARGRFSEQFPRELVYLYQTLEPELVAELLLATDAGIGATTMQPLDMQPPDQQDWLDIEAFAKGYRHYEMCLLPVWKLVCMAFAKASIQEKLTTSQQALLIMRVLQNHPVNSVVDYLGLRGKKQLVVEMRKAIGVVNSFLQNR